MKLPRLKRAALPDGRRVFYVHRDEVRAVRIQAQGYWQHGLEVAAGDVVIDAGANIGLFALDAAQKGARVHAFEPMPATFAALRANARALGKRRICAHRLALGARAEDAQFAYFPFLSALSTRFPEVARRDARAAIERILDDPQLTPRAGWLRAAPAAPRRVFVDAMARAVFWSRPVRCRVEPLSALLHKWNIERVALLKIDVEGAEMDVLRGIAPNDWPRVAQIVAEVHDTEGRLAAMRALLETQGFAVTTELEPDAGAFGIHLLWARR